MRVAFTLIGGKGWTGGINYLENLLSALSELPDRPIDAVLFVGMDADPAVIERLAPYLSEPPIASTTWDRRVGIRLLRLLCGFMLQRDYFAERAFRRAQIDLVFQHQAWYGYLFKVPTLAWIADFQHRRLPAMFSKTRFLWRDFGYKALSRCATRVMVSSLDAKRDCETYYPRSRKRISVLPFVVGSTFGNDEKLIKIMTLYELPGKFFYLPNQLWKHKNHLGVIEALRLLKQKNSDVIVVASGNAQDSRHPKYPEQLLSLVNEYGLKDSFRYLGFIPSRHILPLMRISIAVINPSYFEGWSTTVEEAKAIGAPLLLSNIPIHREQTNGNATYFDPSNPVDLAHTLEACWGQFSAGPRIDAESKAAQINTSRRAIFAGNFVEICKTVLN